MHSYNSIAIALAAAISILSTASAHSWVEQLSVISPNGSFSGAPGYVRGNVLRQGSTDIDKNMVYLQPPDGRDPTQGILPSDPICFPGHQQSQVQTDGSPRLKAAGGDNVALRYQENGHVTLPQNQPGKPANRGTIFVYGTTQSSPDDKFLDIFGKWNADGSGGNKKGKLLATYNFDDGQCYQINGGQISTQRQKQFPKQADPLQGADLWCQADVALPTDAPQGKPYTLYWVWNWPTAPGTPGVPNGKEEIYTSCMDIDITGSNAPAPDKAAVKISQENIGEAGVPNQLSAIQAHSPFNAPTSIVGKVSGDSPQTNAAQAASSTPRPSPSSTPPAPGALNVSPSNAPAQATKTVFITSIITQAPSAPSAPQANSNQSTEPGVPAITLSKMAAPATSSKPCKHKRSRVFGRAHY